MARPIKTFSARQRQQVQNNAAIGLTLEQIAGIMDCTPRTLKKHCSYELQHGKELMKARLVAKSAAIAMGNDAIAQKDRHFLLSRVCGLNEKTDISLSVSHEESLKALENDAEEFDRLRGDQLMVVGKSE